MAIKKDIVALFKWVRKPLAYIVTIIPFTILGVLFVNLAKPFILGALAKFAIAGVSLAITGFPATLIVFGIAALFTLTGCLVGLVVQKSMDGRDGAEVMQTAQSNDFFNRHRFIYSILRDLRILAGIKTKVAAEPGLPRDSATVRLRINESIQDRCAVTKQAKIIVVTSGKGGVGKTTTSAAMATGLALRGHKVVVIDFDVGLRNLDIVMGCERRVVYDLVNVIQGEASLNQALIRDKRVQNLYILPASQTRDKDALTHEGVEKVLEELKQTNDYIICDSPAGIERGAHMAMYHADTAIVVTNPEVSSVRDSDRVLGILASKTKRAELGLEPVTEQLLLTRYSPHRVNLGEMLSISDVLDILAIPLLGVIPESKSVLTASNTGTPVILNEKSDAGLAYTDAVDRLVGEEKPLRFVDIKKKGLLKRLFKTREETHA